MTEGPSQSELLEYAEVARRSAAKASRDDQVIGDATDFALQQLRTHWEHVASAPAARRSWVSVVARNRARRTGAKLHRDLPMGRAGSLPPPMHDEQEDERVEFLIAEMLGGGAMSLGSLVADKVDFERAWKLIAEPDRELLRLKYAMGMSSKEIAEHLQRSPGTVDNQLTAAKKVARLVLENLVGDLDEPTDLP